MTEVELLSVFSHIVNNSDSSHEKYNFFGPIIVEIIPALVATIAVYPLQSKLWLWGCLISHISSYLVQEIQLNDAKYQLLQFCFHAFIAILTAAKHLDHVIKSSTNQNQGHCPKWQPPLLIILSLTFFYFPLRHYFVTKINVPLHLYYWCIDFNWPLK